MAAKIQIPQGAIFQADPEQQIYARGTLDRDMSGLSYMFKNAADTRAQGNQERYMQGVSEANRISQALAQQEMQQDMLVQALKVIPDFAKAGVPISQFPALAQTSATGGTDEQTAQASLLVNLLKQAEIAQKQAAAAGGGAGEEGGKDQVEGVLDATGHPQVKYTARGRGGDERLARWVADAKKKKAAGGVYAPMDSKPPPAGTSKTDPVLGVMLERFK